MKKFFIGLLVVLLIGVVGGYMFKEPLMDALVERITGDMFLTADTDDFDPGLEVGQTFPAINAVLDERSLTSVAEFAGPNGLVFVANRSVDW